MIVQRLFDFELDRVSRDNFSDESSISSFPYISDYFIEKDFCEYNRPKGSEWAAILSFIFVVLGVSTSTAYLMVTFRHSSAALTSNFPFLNNFLLASFINLISNGIFDIHVIKNGCWYGGRLLCKVLPTISDTSENAMVMFMVAIILEQNHPYVRSFLSKKTKFRKRLTITVLWLVTVVFSIPEVIIWDIFEFYESQFCTIRVTRYHHYGMYVQKGLFLEYVVPLLLLVVTLAHAAAVSRKGSSTPTSNQALDESYLRNGDNDRHEETNNQCPPIRVTSAVIGAVLFVTKTPFYLSHFLFAFFDVRSIILSGFSFVLYPVSSIVTPVVVMFSSPFHKKRLKKTYQFIAAYMAGRRVKKGFLLREEDEEKIVRDSCRIKSQNDGKLR